MKTTPNPCRNVLDVLPELSRRALTAIRLHPRPGEIADPGASKIAGEFLWPGDEPWPTCEEHRLPFVGILQLRSKDIPGMAFFPGTDLFQMLWCPRDHPNSPNYTVACRFLWRVTAEIRTQLHPIPIPNLSEDEANGDDGQYLPNPCQLFPERVEEFPPLEQLSPEERTKLNAWDVVPNGDLQAWLERWDMLRQPAGALLYDCQLSTAPGSKVGGHVVWIQGPEVPICACGRRMDHLLTLSTLEGTIGINEGRWLPLEEREEPEEERQKYHYATGLQLGDGGCIYVFVCRLCKDWPVQWVFQCG